MSQSVDSVLYVCLYCCQPLSPCLGAGKSLCVSLPISRKMSAFLHVCLLVYVSPLESATPQDFFLSANVDLNSTHIIWPHCSQWEILRAALGNSFKCYWLILTPPVLHPPLRFKVRLFLHILGILFAVTEAKRNPAFLYLLINCWITETFMRPLL